MASSFRVTKFPAWGNRFVSRNGPITTEVLSLFSLKKLPAQLLAAVIGEVGDEGRVGQPSMQRSATSSFYNPDALGSITSLANAGGTLGQTYTFDSFGKQTASNGSLTSPFRYTGREFDSETGLLYLRARYYSPEVGRFVSEDPIQFNGGINFYSYVRNAPTGQVDP